MIAVVKLRALSSFCIGGDRVVRSGEVFTIDAVSAGEIVAVGRAKLLDESDRGIIGEAVRDQVRRTLASLGPIAAQPGPWLRLH